MLLNMIDCDPCVIRSCVRDGPLFSVNSLPWRIPEKPEGDGDGDFGMAAGRRWVGRHLGAIQSREFASAVTGVIPHHRVVWDAGF